MTITHRLRLFGRVVLEQAERPAWRFPTRKSIALLGYLVRQSHPVPRSELTNLLWGDLPDARSRRNLTRELSQLSTQLPNCFQADYHTIRWAPPASIWVDTTAFLALLAPDRAAPAHPLTPPKPAPSDPWFDRPGAAAIDSALLAAAVALYGGEFMDSLYLDDCPEFETWLLRERELWRRLVLEQLELLIAHHALHQQDMQAIVFARRCLELEPWHEEAHRALMILLARGGNRAAALAQYEACRRMLAAELALAPAPETTALYEQIRAGASSELGVLSSELPRHQLKTQNLELRTQQQNWGGVPEVQRFFGREAELANLRRWIVDERCRVISILGMGGIGKTLLAAQVAHAVANRMDRVIWRSLLNAPPLDTLLRGIVATLSDEPPAGFPADLDQQLALLIDLLCRWRCLLILDNIESIFQPGARAGAYRDDFTAYEQLLRALAEHSHQSCLLLTSREQPQGVRLQAGSALVQSLRLNGLAVNACRQILHGRRLDESLERADALIQRYSGNPLALTLVAETIQEIFAGDVRAFLHDDTLIFDDIRDVLDQQWERLTALERDVLLWLAVAREAMSPDQLQHDLIGDLPRSALLEALRSLVRRSLVQSEGAGFTLQNVVMEYTTNRLIDQVCAEIARGAADRFNTHALIKAQAKEYVRASQVRLILQPVAARLIANLGRALLEQRLRQILSARQAAALRAPGYAGGNTLNLLLHLAYDLRGYDFSRISVWQADLGGVWLSEMSFADADLTGSVFTDTVQAVQPVVFSPDDTLLAVGTSAGEIRLWRTADWQLVDVITSDGGIVWTLCFSPDGWQFASGAVDGNVRVWDVHTHQMRRVLSGHTQPVSFVDWSAGDKIVSAGGWDHTVRLWDARSGAALGTLEGHTGFVSSVVFSPDGAMIASSDWDGRIYLWDAQTRQVVHALSCGAQITQISFSHDGRLLVGAIERSVWLWDVLTGALISTLEHLGAEVRYLVCSPTDALAAIGIDRIVSLRDLRTGHVVQTLHGHTDRIRSFAWRHDGAALATWADETVRVWDSATGDTLAIVRGFTPAVHSVALGADGAYLVSGCANGRMHVWDTRTWQLRHMLEGHTGIVTSIAFSTDRTTFASASTDHTIRIWRMGSVQALQTLHAHDNAVTVVAFSPDGRLLASASEDCSIRLWDAATGRVRHDLRGHSGSIACVAWSPDGSLLASCSDDRTVRLWDTSTGASVAVLTDHRELVRAVVFDPTGQFVTSAAVDGIVRNWNIRTAVATHMAWQIPLGISQLAYSPDGSTLLACGAIEAVYVCDVARDELLHRLDGHTGWVQSVAWLPDGTGFVSASHDGALRLWDVQTGACLRVLRAPGPYAGMNITGATGVTEAQRVALKALGAVDEL